MTAIIFSFAATAQSGNFYSQYNKVLDTITNSGSKTLTAPVIAKAYSYCTVSVTAVSISGTVGLNAVIQHDAGNGNFYTLAGDTIAISAAGTKGYKWAGYADKGIRLVVTGTGTQSTKISAAFTMR